MLRRVQCTSPCPASANLAQPEICFIQCRVVGTGATTAAASLTSQPYFSAYAHARVLAKVGGGREGKIHLGKPARYL